MPWWRSIIQIKAGTYGIPSIRARRSLDNSIQPGYIKFYLFYLAQL
jgi:hypothetical protein